MSGAENIKCELEAGVGLLTLNRPRALNALTLDMLKSMTETLTRWEKEEEVKLIIVVGEGERAFCSGGDVKSIAAARDQPAVQREFLQWEYRLDLLISRLATPYLAVWDGLVMGGGVGISRMGLLRLATERTVFAMPECGIGLIPDVGSSHFLSLLQGNLGLCLGLTGQRVGGWECSQLGLATHYVRSEDVQQVIKHLRTLSSSSSSSSLDIVEVNKVLAAFQQSSPIENNAGVLTENLEEINAIFSLGSLPEIIQKCRSDSSEFSCKILSLLERCSPTSLQITFHQLRTGRAREKVTYQEALQLEYRLMTRRFLDADFYEGVRAALVEKDGRPVWSPARTEADIQQYFDQLGEEEELELGE